MKSYYEIMMGPSYCYVTLICHTMKFGREKLTTEALEEGSNRGRIKLMN